MTCFLVIPHLVDVKICVSLIAKNVVIVDQEWLSSKLAKLFDEGGLMCNIRH